MKKKVMVIFGTRPEAIKMCPLVKELYRNSDYFETVVCTTGQHRQMLDQVLTVFGVVPDYDLEIMKENQTLYDITANVLLKIQKVLKEERPDIILVHGDTATTFAAALGGFYSKIKIGHVEAGLRTWDIYNPFPEEFNRRSVTLISDLNFSPTENAQNNLIHEGIDKDKIFITGNTAIDALKTTIKDGFSHEILEWVGDNRMILVTAHRRENLGKPMTNMFKAIKRVVDETKNVKVVYPIHMNPVIRKLADDIFKNDNNFLITNPLDVVDFHNIMAKSYLILTDSGGIQEEAPSLGKPVLVMRETTERPEGIEAGTLKLVGTEEENIYQSFKELLNDQLAYDKMSKANNPYGDGTASEKIIKILKEKLNEIDE